MGFAAELIKNKSVPFSLNTAEEELASLFQIHLVRPLPTLVTLGGVLDVVYLLDSPHGFTWKGVYLDAAMRFVELFGGVSPSDSEPAQLFMQLATLENSILENRIFEDGFEVESVSTAKLLAFAADKAIPVAVIDAENVDADLPLLN